MLKPWNDDRLAANGRAVHENLQLWFESSKVVDIGGLPLVVYHGTKRHFSVFDAGAKGAYAVGVLGHFFSADPATANMYAKGRSGNVIPVYLSLQNPKVEGIKRLGRFEDADEAQEYLREAKEDGYDGFVFAGPGNSTEYVAFNPAQIKSATGNSGLYLRDNPSISDCETSLALLHARQAKVVVEKTTKKNGPKVALC